MEYSLAIALEDFLPVILSALGFTWIAQRLATRSLAAAHLAWLGAALIVAGGLAKASWKLIIAASGADVAVLNNSLFPLMAPGFIWLAWALWCGLKREPSKSGVWLAPLLVSALALGYAGYSALTKGGRGWVFILIGVTTLGNLLVSVQLIANAGRRRLWLAAALFAYNLITIFVQARLARLPQTISLQWLEQINNTLSWAAFAAAAYLWRKE